MCIQYPQHKYCSRTLPTVHVLVPYILYQLYMYCSRTYNTFVQVLFPYIQYLCTGTIHVYILLTVQVLFPYINYQLYRYCSRTYTTHCTSTVPVHTQHYPLYCRTFTTHYTGTVPVYTLPAAQVMFPYISIPTAKVLFPYIYLFQHISMLESYFNLNSSLLLTLLSFDTLIILIAASAHSHSDFFSKKIRRCTH